MSTEIITLQGTAHPLGATLMEHGVNFSVFSPLATEVELLLFEHVEDMQPTIIKLDPEENKSYYYWHIFVPHLKENQLYAYRVHGPHDPAKGYLFDGAKVLVDPYAKAIVGEYDRTLANEFGKCNLHSCLKSAVINDNFDWDHDIAPNHDLSESVVYEMHLAGFTAHPNSGVTKKWRGTYRGLIEKIDYLKEMGITAVELLPVFAFDAQDAPGDRHNYWGYSPINFFAPHAAYASSKEPQAIVNEFKEMVKALHKANIEVILDVVYNHTTENDPYNDGPTLSHRGFSNYSYYMLDEQGYFRNYTGTGNTFNANHSVARRMILHSLRYWVQEMHVDGFRFDLASVLSRNEQGQPTKNPPILWSIDSDPILCDTKIIAEPWDAAGLYQVNNFAGDRWVIWNDAFRNTMRKYVKGDPGQVSDVALRLLGSPNDLQARYSAFDPKQSLHFITCHDGFTLNDLVSYNEKHNLANGEENRDGSNENFSWNCGVEGNTQDENIQQIRVKQIKNLLALLFLSHGTPMLNMGDEVRRTQNGNNNAYCQNNEISWFDWDLLQKNEHLFTYVKKLIGFKKQFKTFSHHTYFSNYQDPESPYVDFHGTQLHKPDWSYYSHTLACEINSPIYHERLFLITNMYWEPLDFELPPDTQWQKVLDTHDSDSEDAFVSYKIKCAERSVVLLAAAHQKPSKAPKPKSAKS